MNPQTQKQTDDMDITQYLIRPRVARAAAWLHETFFAPIDRALDALTTWHTKNLLAPYLNPPPPTQPKQ
jgi:hypothetical protein